MSDARSDMSQITADQRPDPMPMVSVLLSCGVCGYTATADPPCPTSSGGKGMVECPACRAKFADPRLR